MSHSTATGSIVRLRYHGFIPAAYVVRLFVLLSKGLDSYEMNNKEGQAQNGDAAWGAVLAQGFSGGAVSVLRLAGPPPAGDVGIDSLEEKEVGEEIAAEKGDDDDDDGNEDVSMADVIATDTATSADADGEGKTAAELASNTAQAQSEKGLTRPKTAKEGARIICWEYPAPLL